MAGYGWQAGAEGGPQGHWVPPSYCQGTLEWIPGYQGAVPPSAVPAGIDLDGSPLLVGRAFHCGELLPAKISPSHGCAFVSYEGSEVSKSEYEVLITSHAAWKYARGGDVPHQAIRIGHTQNGEALFMGRTMHEGALTPGKIHPSHGCLYIPYDGREISFSEYEVLILV